MVLRPAHAHSREGEKVPVRYLSQVLPDNQLFEPAYEGLLRVEAGRVLLLWQEVCQEGSPPESRKTSHGGEALPVQDLWRSLQNSLQLQQTRERGARGRVCQPLQ